MDQIKQNRKVCKSLEQTKEEQNNKNQRGINRLEYNRLKQKNREEQNRLEYNRLKQKNREEQNRLEYNRLK